jgi:hypothetical protein
VLAGEVIPLRMVKIRRDATMGNPPPSSVLKQFSGEGSQTVRKGVSAVKKLLLKIQSIPCESRAHNEEREKEMSLWRACAGRHASAGKEREHITF